MSAECWACGWTTTRAELNALYALTAVCAWQVTR
jgi:hypothetical protein